MPELNGPSWSLSGIWVLSQGLLSHSIIGTRRYLTIGTEHPNPQGWYRAGYLSVYSDFSGIGKTRVVSKTIPIDQTVLIDCGDEFIDLLVEFKPVKWIEGLTVSLWEWTGENDDQEITVYIP